MKPKLEIISVQYVYDPNAAKKWFSLWVDLVKEELMAQVNTNLIEDKHEGEDHETNGRLLPELVRAPEELNHNSA